MVLVVVFSFLSQLLLLLVFLAICFTTRNSIAPKGIFLVLYLRFVVFIVFSFGLLFAR